MAKIKKYKVGLDSETYAISLVEEGAIMEDFVYMKNNDEMRKLQLSTDEKHMIYGAVLIPNLNIYRYDGENEYYVQFSAEAIEKMSVEFMREYRQHNITLDHESEASEIWVTESWLKSDMDKDKSVALGLNPNLPVGTWIVGMKCNNIETWERIKDHSLNGFSVESLVSLEELDNYSKQEKMEMNDSFWTKMKNMLIEVFASNKNEDVELEEQPVEPTPAEPAPVVEEPAPVQEPVVEEPAPAPEPVVEEPKAEPAPNPLEDLIKSLQAEIESLKETNAGLVNKVNDLSKQPSAKPISTVGASGGNGGDTFQSWREQMARYM